MLDKGCQKGKGERMSRFFKWIKQQISQAIPAILFFLVAFNLINFTERLILGFYQVNDSYLSYLNASIGALLVGKLLLIVNEFPQINQFPNKPLIYNISWKFCIYSFFTLVFRIGEEFIELLIHHRSLDFIYGYFSFRLTSPAFWAVQLWLFMLFFLYVVANEFIRAIGRDKVKIMLFGVSKNKS